MKYKQNMLDLLEEIKDKVLISNASPEEKDIIVSSIDEARNYFNDYASEIAENGEELKDKINQILDSELYIIERMTED
ncbi:MAG: hypothetical protein KH333_10220 [Clostridium sp.]|nr:hypothetical protein [Clostridium sp.]